MTAGRGDPTKDTLASAFAEAERGRCGPLEASVAALDLSDSARRIWSRVVEAMRHSAGLGPDPGVTPEELSGAASDPAARDGALRLCSWAGRLAVVRLDRPALARWVESSSRLAEDALNRSRVELLRAWLATLAGADAPGDLDAIARVGRTEMEASLPVEATSLAALLAAGRGDLAGAVAYARRASRMGRTEALPQQEYLANWVLARMRRKSGHPHLAVRILSALHRVATDSFAPLLEWELLLSRGLERVRDPLDSTLDAWVGPLRALLTAARAGDRAGFDRARAGGAHLSELSAPHHRDFEAAAALLDPELAIADVEGDDIHRWKRGEVHEVPLGLHGLGAADGASGETAFVVSRPSGPPQRVLSDGARLVADATRIEVGGTKQARTDSTIAVLALAGHIGVEHDALFERVYGFPYGGERHRGVRDVLIHRVRARLDGAATLDREGSRFRLTHGGVLVVPDPRSSPPPEHSLLHEVAKLGHLSAAEAASRLRINVRSAQRAFKRLVEEGVCEAVKDGRNLEFYLDDTTFREPTGVIPARPGDVKS
jgi:hypothetical protein